MSSPSEAAGASANHGDITLVAPNGAQLSEAYHPNQKIGHVLQVAVKRFGKQGDLDPSKPYILVKGESPLESEATLAEAGIKAGDTLKVRSRGIPGDG